MSISVKVENLSKAYQLGQIGTGTISRDLERWYARFRGKEDPFLKIGESNVQNTKSTNDVVWSLKDINFEIEQGDAVGIIGRNGAGKSTLLKILSKVTAPTTGKISGRGRIASLLEVGTGFHPELSGRENIFLNGAILGMRKKEIQRKLEEIVDFAGVERYLDTPVKRYSSGMYVRLAFAVAAHLESEILIVDEVLAVGDAEFQKKCLGKMNDVSKGEGRTVLFVSHNMGSVQQLCRSAIYLDAGSIKKSGQVAGTISNYLSGSNNRVIFSVEKNDNNLAQLTNAVVLTNSSDNLIVRLNIFAIRKVKVSLDFRIHDFVNACFAFASLGVKETDKLLQLEVGENQFTVALQISNLAFGNYNLSIDLTEPNKEYYDRVEFALAFEVVDTYTSSDVRYLRQDWNYGAYQMKLELLNDQ